MSKKEESIKELSKIRVILDDMLNSINNEREVAVKEGYIRELALAQTAVEKGRMYLGECQHDLGAEYPYKDTNKAKDAKGIALAADRATEFSVLKGNNVENLGKLRDLLDNSTNIALDTYSTGRKEVKLKGKDKFVADCNLSEAYRSLKEGRMWLGCAMGVIKSNSLKK